eukprot:3211134-Prymnesium_polylepis.1
MRAHVARTPLSDCSPPAATKICARAPRSARRPGSGVHSIKLAEPIKSAPIASRGGGFAAFARLGGLGGSAAAAVAVAAAAAAAAPPPPPPLAPPPAAGCGGATCLGARGPT